jgi:hypothetical protein
MDAPVRRAPSWRPAPDQLIRRWLKANVLEDEEIHPSEKGTPQGASISVLLSNLYLHYVLDLWFERVVKPRLQGEAYLVRYIDDFVMCFQYRADALRVEQVLSKRLGKFSLTWNRPRPNWLNLVDLHNVARANTGQDVRRLSIFWVLRCIARAI